MAKKLKLHLWISHLFLAAGVIAAIGGLSLGKGQEGIHYLIWVAAALALGSVVYKVLTLKCPHCGGFLSAKYKLPKTCSACGRSIFEEEIFHEETHP